MVGTSLFSFELDSLLHIPREVKREGVMSGGVDGVVLCAVQVSLDDKGSSMMRLRRYYLVFWILNDQYCE